jgi:hypothetical protein
MTGTVELGSGDCAVWSARAGDSVVARNMGLDMDSPPGDQRRMRSQINLICVGPTHGSRRSLGDQIGG